MFMKYSFTGIRFPIGETGYLYDTPGIMRYDGGLENILTRDEVSATIGEVLTLVVPQIDSYDKDKACCT